MSAYQLLAILRECADEAVHARERERYACPNDGEPYITGPDGSLFCRFCSFRPGETGQITVM